MATRVVVPLFRLQEVPRPVRALEPVLEVDGESFVMVTPMLIGIAESQLGARVASLAGSGPTILAALDFLLTGS